MLVNKYFWIEISFFLSTLDRVISDILSFYDCYVKFWVRFWYEIKWKPFEIMAVLNSHAYKTIYVPRTQSLIWNSENQTASKTKHIFLLLLQKFYISFITVQINFNIIDSFNCAEPFKNIYK